jgi:hypothetical protein
MKLIRIVVGTAIAAALAGCAVIPTPRGAAVVPLLPPPPPFGWYQPVPIYPDFELALPPPIILRGPYGIPEPVPDLPPSSWW